MAAPGSIGVPPPVNGEEIASRLLKLLEGITSREDLSLQRVQDVTGLTLERASGATFLGRTQPMKGGGSYIITFVPETASIKRGVGLDFTVADPNGAALKCLLRHRVRVLPVGTDRIGLRGNAHLR